MNDNEGIFMGLICGFFLSWFLYVIFDDNTILKNKCEYNLPRNRHCKIIAVPEENYE